MDLGCLMTAEMQRKPWKSTQQLVYSHSYTGNVICACCIHVHFFTVIKSLRTCSYRSEVVTLQFSNERRDRRKREYVMIEENHDYILSILAPISEENRKAFSLASKVEASVYITHVH